MNKMSIGARGDRARIDDAYLDATAIGRCVAPFCHRRNCTRLGKLADKLDN